MVNRERVEYGADLLSSTLASSGLTHNEGVLASLATTYYLIKGNDQRELFREGILLLYGLLPPVVVKES